MKSDTPLDYAVFQLSPKRSRCELFVSGDGATEKLTSGLLKPFVAHLAIAEEQVAKAAQSIKLEVDKHKNAGTWFTRGTLERFVRFVSTPEVLELVSTFDAEMSQLEGARKIYSQGGEKLSGSLSISRGDGIAAQDAADITKKELLRAIDLRLDAVKQDLTTALARASAAGFTLKTVSELRLFADRFGAHHLNKACSEFISLCQRRPELICAWKNMDDDQAVRMSFGSDMSIDDLAEESGPSGPSWLHQSLHQYNNHQHQQDHDATKPSENSKSSTCEKPSLSFPTRRSDERGEVKEGTAEKEKDMEESVTKLSEASSQPSRRLSVQDRINMFENKQKEKSGSVGTGKVALGKSAELRRQSSDVLSTPPVVEKAVLRRWSGASDMSMDLSNDQKEMESSLTAPGSSANSQTQSSKSSKFASLNEDNKDDVTSHNTILTSKVESKGSSGRLDDSGFKDLPVTQTQVTNSGSRATALFGGSGDVCLKDQLTSQTQVNAQTSKLEKAGWKDQAPLESQSHSYSSVGDAGFKAVSQTQFRSYPAGAEQSGLRDESSSQNTLRTPVGAEFLGVKDQAVSQSQFLVLSGQDAGKIPCGASMSRTGSGEQRDHPAGLALFKGSPGAILDLGSDSKPPPVSHTQGKAFSDKLDIGPELKDQSAFQVQYRGSEGRWSSFPGKVDMGRKDLASLGMQHGDLPSEMENNLQGMKLQRQNSASELSKKSKGRKGESTPVNGNSEMFFPERKIIKSSEVFDSATTTPIEQVQKVRQSKGSQERNDELQLKADELEKIFAAHKLRVTGDQPSSGRRAKGPNAPVEQVDSATYKTSDEVTPTQMREIKPVAEPHGSSSNIVEFDFSSLIKMVDNQDYGNAIRQNITEFGSSEDSRGKFYDRYMQKREEKLRVEWNSKGSQKEAKLKAMQDSLERSRAEMKTKLLGTPNQDSARRRMEKLRSFNVRLASKNREQQPIESALNENDEEPLETVDTPLGRQVSFSGTASADSSYRNTQSKKPSPSRSLLSSTPRTAAMPASRLSAKGSNSSSGRQRILPENSLSQSVPNFSDLRKENTKPSTGISKITNRSQFRNSTRSKNTNVDLPLVKEEKPRRSHSMRKSFAGPDELKALSPEDPDGVVLAPVRFSNEQTDEGFCGKSPEYGESKHSFRKGNGIIPGSGAGVSKMKASTVSEDHKNEEDLDEVADQPDDSVDMVRGEEEEEEEEFERVIGDEALKAGDFPADSDNEKSRLSQESEKSSDPGSENVDVLRSLAQVDNSMVVDAVASGPISIHGFAGNVNDSPGESPAASWNSHVHHPFSYANETSDIDACVESPVGSPASWNLHSLSQMESDAARMRKKWGSAQKPVLVAANTSHHLSRKDMTKGFKRLLKFGRKSRGSESLVDWISATTSEGDDDTEDGRDPINRSSEDVRKSRMGSSQGHPSYDGFNEGELFDEQVQALNSSIPAPPANFKLREDQLSGSSLKAPRSFFSLSSFRSKGTESRPR